MILLRFFIIKNEYKRCAVQQNSVVSAKSTAIATTASANVSWRSSRIYNWFSYLRVSITVYLFNISLLLGNIRYKCMFLRSTLSGHGLFYHGMVTEAGELALIFISPGILPALRNCREIHIDATFHIVSVLFYQLMTLHVMAYGQVSLLYQWTINICNKIELFYITYDWNIIYN